MRFHPDRDVNRQLEKLFDKGIDFIDNLRGGFVEFTTTGGTETIRHNLGYIPAGYLVVYLETTSNEPIFLYAEAPTTWTKEVMFLRSNVANVVVRLYVM